MSPVCIIIDKTTFLNPAATNYHIMGLMGFRFGGLAQNSDGGEQLLSVKGDGDTSWSQENRSNRTETVETGMAATSWFANGDLDES